MPETELLTIEPANPSDLFTPDAIGNVLAQIRALAAKQVPDLSTAAGRDAIGSFAYKVSRAKVAVDNVGKDYVAELKALPKKIDAIRKTWRDEMDVIRDEARKPLTEWEAEQERIAAEKEAARQYDKDWLDAHAEYDEREERARHERELAEREEKLRKQQEELDRKEAEQKAKEEAARLEQEQKEREERIAREAAEKAQREAEEKIKREQEAREQAEREKIEAEARAKAEKEAAVRAAEQRAKEEAEQRERERQEAEAKAKAEAERKAANRRHRTKVQNDAIDGMLAVISGFDVGFNTDHAGEIIKAIDEGRVPNVTLNY